MKKVFNLTDVETPVLKQRQLVNHSIVVGPALLAPGQSAEVDADRLKMLEVGLRDLTSCGALAVGDQPPATYVMAKERMKAEKPAAPPVAAAAPEPEAAPPASRKKGAG